MRAAESLGRIAGSRYRSIRSERPSGTVSLCGPPSTAAGTSPRVLDSSWAAGSHGSTRSRLAETSHHRQGRAAPGARLDPQHAVGRGPHGARRRDAHDAGGRSRAGRHRPAGVGRQGAGGPAARRRKEPADRRGGPYRRVCAGGEVRRSGGREVHGRRPGQHGVLGHDGGLRPGDRSRGCDGQRDRARQDQPPARQREFA